MTFTLWPVFVYILRMGFRFRKSITILPGIRWNISKRSTSISFGGKGLTVNLNNKGTRTTVGLPGSGMSYSGYRPYSGINVLGALLIIGIIAAAVFWSIS